MKTPSSRIRQAQASRRGAALLLAFLLLVVIAAIVLQIGVSTGTEARVTRNDLALSAMDMAIESALLQVKETLKSDAEAAAAGGGAPATGAGGAPAPGAGGAPAPGAAGGGGGQPCDSRRDEWASPQRTEINEVRLRILVVDEDSKYNVLNLLNADEAQAQAAFDRVVRILDLCREGTLADIDTRTAEEMARTLRDHMLRRRDSKLPRPRLLTDDERDQDRGFPLTLRELAVLPPFDESHFRDYRDADGRVVHGIGSFLTCWSSLTTAGDLARSSATSAAAASVAAAGGSAGAAGGATGASAGAAGAAGGAGGAGGAGAGGAAAGGKGSSAQGAAGAAAGQAGGAAGAAAGGSAAAGGAAGGTAGGAAGGAAAAAGSGSSKGGWAVNVNTAPVAVLKGLFDSRDVPLRFWDRVIEYRNLEEEPEAGAPATETEQEAQLDEYGQEAIQRRIFESTAELAEVEGYGDLPPEMQGQIEGLLATQSNVFSVYVVARRVTASTGDESGMLSGAELRRAEETRGDSLVRVVRSVWWRRDVDGEVLLTPVMRWEVLDYLPYEVLDFPPDDR